MPQKRLTVRDDTGRTVTFDWHGDGTPTDDDLEEVFAAAKAGDQKKNDDSMNLSRVLGREATPQNFKLPAQQYNTPKLQGVDLQRRPVYGRGGDFSQKQAEDWVRDQAPTIGATIAGTAASIGSGGLLLPAIAAGGGAYLGSRARGDSREDAATEGVKTGVMSVAVPGAIKAVTRAGPWLQETGENVARSYLKPTVAAGRKEAMRLFGRPINASQANKKVVERLLDRNILGADNPELALQEAIEASEGKLQKMVGDQPTRLNEYLRSVFDQGIKAAKGSAKDIPGAIGTIENEIARTRSGSLGPKLDFGESIPSGPTPSGNLSAASLLEKMKGKQPTPGVPAPQAPNLARNLQRIEAQGAGGNITTGVPIMTQEVKGPALATSRLEAPFSGQTPRRFAGGGATQVMREAPAGSQTGDLIARNYSGEVKAPITQLIDRHRPPPVTAREALNFVRSASGETNWDKPSSKLVDWFLKRQEGAGRAAIKKSVPGSGEVLNELGALLSGQRVLPQAMNREMNKNTVARLPGMIAGAAAGSPKQALGALIGVNMADKNSGQIAQTLYNLGKKIPGVSPQTAEAISRTILTKLLSMTNEGSGTTPEDK